MCYDVETGCECECCQADSHPRWNYIFDESTRYREALEKICKLQRKTLFNETNREVWDGYSTVVLMGDIAVMALQEE